jgi:methyl-accepting chemotaxis protein
MNKIRDAQSEENERATAEILRVVEAITNGQLDVRGDPAQFSGPPAELVAGVNRMLEALIDPLRLASHALDRIAHGSIPEFVIRDYEGEFNQIKHNVNTFLATMYGMHHEIGNFVQAIKNGRLLTRANHWDYDGKWRDLIEGLNEVIDTFMGPFQVSAEYIRSISRGEIPEPIRGGYKGGFNEMRRSVNTLIAAVNAVIADLDRLCTAAIAGQLSTRVDADRHGGDFRKIVAGVNRTMDGVVSPLAESAIVLANVAAGDLSAVVEGDYQGEFAKLQHDINTMVRNLRGSIQNIGRTAEALAAASSQLEGISEQLTANAGETSALADKAAAASQNVSRNVAVAVAGSETISSSVRETLERANDASRITASTAQAADSASDAIGKLEASSDNIGGVIGTISTITGQIDILARQADQQAIKASEAGRGFGVVADEVKRLAQKTRESADEIGGHMEQIRAASAGGNDLQQVSEYTKEIGRMAQTIDKLGIQIHLLSLNASIEAARAEEAGRRVCDVAAGVKELSSGTARAAGDIERQVEAIRGDSQTAVSVMGEITDTVHQIASASSVIATAVAKDAAITADVRSNLTSAAEGTREVAQSVSAVAEAALNTSRAARETQSASASLSGMAENLRALVASFRV